MAQGRVTAGLPKASLRALTQPRVEWLHPAPQRFFSLYGREIEHMRHAATMSIGEVLFILALFVVGIVYAVITANGDRAEIEARDRDPYGFVRNRFRVSVTEVLFVILVGGVSALEIGVINAAYRSAGMLFAVALVLAVALALYDSTSMARSLAIRAEDPMQVVPRFTPPLSEIFGVMLAVVAPLGSLAIHWSVSVVAGLAVVGAVVFALRELGAMEAWSSRRT